MGELIQLLKPIYVPLAALLAPVPGARVLLVLIGIASFVALLSAQGWSRWVAVLIGLYLLGGAWMWPYVVRSW